MGVLCSGAVGPGQQAVAWAHSPPVQAADETAGGHSGEAPRVSRDGERKAGRRLVGPAPVSTGRLLSIQPPSSPAPSLPPERLASLFHDAHLSYLHVPEPTSELAVQQLVGDWLPRQDWRGGR